MAEIIYAVNQTGSDATIIDMGEVVVPGSGQVDLGALYPVEFVYRSENLKELINQDIIRMSPDGTALLNQTDSLEFVQQEVHYLSRDATSIIGTGVLGTTPISQDVIQFNQSLGLWEPAQIQQLPTGSLNDTLRYDGGWKANSSVTSDGTNLLVSGDQTTVGVGFFSNHIQIGDVASSPYTPQAGDVRWDTTAFSGYDGTNWSTLSHVVTYRYSLSTGVPTAGLRYMVTGNGVACSAAGDHLAKDSRITTITIEVAQVDTARSFDIEVLDTPSGTVPAVLATLTLPISTKGTFTTSLDVLVNAGSEIGVRIVRATGTGQSTWKEANVTIGMIQ